MLLKKDLRNQNLPENKINIQVGGSIFSTLLVIFIVLKILNILQWSWWWVLSPLWIPLLLVFIFSLLSLFLDSKNK